MKEGEHQSDATQKLCYFNSTALKADTADTDATLNDATLKSGKNYTLSSLKKFRAKYSEQLNIPYVLHTGDLKVEEGIVYLPLYMTPLL